MNITRNFEMITSFILTVMGGLLFIFFLLFVALVIATIVTPLLFALLLFYCLLTVYRLSKRLLKQERSKDVL